MKKQPEITERTRQRFVEAFWSLVQEKPMGKISVSELTKRAGYNRSTFYEYFMDTDELVAYVETGLLAQLKETIRQAMSEHDSVGAMFQIIFAAMFAAMNEKIYLLLGANGDSAFLARVQSEMLPFLEAYFPISKDTPYFDYLICFASSALFGMLQRWNEKGKDVSTEEISGLMQDLVLKGLTSRVSPQVVM